jgi:hypothetical protein
MRRLSVVALAVVNLGLLGACGGARQGQRSDFAPPLIAYGRPSTDVPAARAAQADPIIQVDHIAEKILQDPQRLAETRQWIVRQIVRQTRNISGERYERAVRSSLARKLGEAGLSPGDVAYILRDVERTRR